MSLTPNQLTEQIRGQLGVDISRDKTDIPKFPLPQLEEDYKGTQKGKFRREEFSFTKADQKRYDTAKDRVVIKFLEFKRDIWNNLFDPILQDDPQGRMINVEDENFDEKLSSGKWLVAFNLQMPFTEIMIRYDKLVEARQNRKGNQKYKKNFEERCFEYLMLWWNSTPDFVKQAELKKIMDGSYKRYNFFQDNDRGERYIPNTESMEEIANTTNKKLIKLMSNYEYYDFVSNEYIGEVDINVDYFNRFIRPRYILETGQRQMIFDREEAEEQIAVNRATNLDLQSRYIDTKIFEEQQEKEDIVEYSIGKVLKKVDKEIEEKERKESRRLYRIGSQIVNPIITEDILTNVMEQIPMSMIDDNLYNYQSIRGNRLEIPNYWYDKEDNIDDDLDIFIADTEEGQRKQGFYVKKFFDIDNPNRDLDLVENKSLGGLTQLDFDTGIINQYFNYNVDRLRNISSITLKDINERQEKLLIPVGDNNFVGLVGAENKKGYYWDKSGYAFQERLYMINPNNLGFYANQSFLGNVIFKVKIAFSKRTNTISYTHLPIGYFYLPPTTDLKIRRGRFTKIKDLLKENRIITKNAGFNTQMPTNANDKSFVLYKKKDGKDYQKEYPNYPTFLQILYSVFEENRYLEDDNTEGFNEDTMETALNKMNILIKKDLLKGLKNTKVNGFRYGLSERGFPVGRLNGEFLSRRELRKI